MYAAFVDPRDIMVRAPPVSPCRCAHASSCNMGGFVMPQRYTRARAECKQEVGGVYSVFDGSIEGERARGWPGLDHTRLTRTRRVCLHAL